jgi:hypothetical protein
MPPTDAQRTCFEAGIKFGSLYHQFAGTPVSPDSAPSLARAMEDAIENQPHCETVDVTFREGILEEACEGPHGYTELTGRLFEVEIEVADGEHRAHASMAMEDGYPLMRLDHVEERS